MTTRALLARVRKLEADRISPILAKLGGEAGLAAFEAEVAAGMKEGRYDPRDAPVVMASLAEWIRLGDI